MAELVTIPISFFEITTDYERPDIRLLGDRTHLVHGLLEAWAPFKPALDDIDVLTAGKISDQGLLLKLPQKQISFFVGATFCRFSRNAVSWELAKETIEILDLTIGALARITGIVLGQKHTTMGMHLQPRTLSFKDILHPFVPSQLAAIESSPIQTTATITKWGNRAVTIDGSGSLANGVFLKLERNFSSPTSYDEMAKQLWSDEREIFSIMGIEEERP